MPVFRILAAICDPWSITNICIVLFWLRERLSGKADMLIILWSVIRDQWFSNIKFSKNFLKICQPLEFLPRSVIRDPLLIFVFYYSDYYSGKVDMHLILWSVIRVQWFSKIEFFKFFLRICQPLEFLLRSVIHDPLLIFVFYYSG